jgi:hypothetical protein
VLGGKPSQTPDWLIKAPAKAPSTSENGRRQFLRMIAGKGEGNNLKISLPLLDD